MKLELTIDLDRENFEPSDFVYGLYEAIRQLKGGYGNCILGSEDKKGKLIYEIKKNQSNLNMKNK